MNRHDVFGWLSLTFVTGAWLALLVTTEVAARLAHADRTRRR